MPSLHCSIALGWMSSRNAVFVIQAGYNSSDAGFRKHRLGLSTENSLPLVVDKVNGMHLRVALALAIGGDGDAPRNVSPNAPPQKDSQAQEPAPEPVHTVQKERTSQDDHTKNEEKTRLRQAIRRARAIVDISSLCGR